MSITQLHSAGSSSVFTSPQSSFNQHQHHGYHNEPFRLDGIRPQQRQQQQKQPYRHDGRQRISNPRFTANNTNTDTLLDDFDPASVFMDFSMGMGSGNSTSNGNGNSNSNSNNHTSTTSSAAKQSKVITNVSSSAMNNGRVSSWSSASSGSGPGHHATAPAPAARTTSRDRTSSSSMVRNSNNATNKSGGMPHHSETFSNKSHPTTTASSVDGKKHSGGRRLSSSSSSALTTKGYRRHYANHNYHDHSHLTEHDVQEEMANKQNRRGGVHTPFPCVLHKLLEDADTNDYAHVVSWQPHGRGFLIHDHKRFKEEVLPLHFKHGKISSFQRQLSLYGFNRLTHNGPDRGGYYHECFLRGRPFLCCMIQRTRIKGTWIRKSSSPESEPDFYSMPVVGERRSNGRSNKVGGGIASTTTSSNGPSRRSRKQPQPSTAAMAESYQSLLGLTATAQQANYKTTKSHGYLKTTTSSASASSSPRRVVKSAPPPVETVSIPRTELTMSANVGGNRYPFSPMTRNNNSIHANRGSSMFTSATTTTPVPRPDMVASASGSNHHHHHHAQHNSDPIQMTLEDMDDMGSILSDTLDLSQECIDLDRVFAV